MASASPLFPVFGFPEEIAGWFLANRLPSHPTSLPYATIYLFREQTVQELIYSSGMPPVDGWRSVLHPEKGDDVAKVKDVSSTCSDGRPKAASR